MILIPSLVLSLFFVFYHVEATVSAQGSDPIVNTRSGQLQGFVDKSNVTGETFLSFLGVPYAKPPVGGLRFENPVPVDSWSGVREAKVYGQPCTQRRLVSPINGEDCLYLNVYVRGSSVPSQKRPVIVWIYGGSWLLGNGDDSIYGPDYFMRKDIVFVTFNYRLGVFGFLDLEDVEVPGNQGMQDQLLVLKWVRDNIANFGGDPDNVTVMGQNVGGSSAHIFALSPVAKGLFHKLIIQSGNLFNQQLNVIYPKEITYRMCESLGNNSRDPKQIKEFLKTIDYKTLLDLQDDLHMRVGSVVRMIPFSYCNDYRAKNPILPEGAFNPLPAIQIPVMIGYNSDESLLTLKDFGNDSEVINNNFESYFPPAYPDYIKHQYNLNLNDIKNLYFENGQITQENYKNISNLFSDVLIAEGIHSTLQAQVNKSKAPTYFYIYTYDKTLSYLKQISEIFEKGAAHTDEMDNLFRRKLFESWGLPPLQKGTDPHRLMEQMIEMWVNFATTGNPTPTTSNLLPEKWLPVNNMSNFLYLNIGEKLRMETMPSLVDRFFQLNAKKKV